MYIPAKSELSGMEEIESRKEYFLKFNYVYQPDELVGVWWQFRSKLMTIEEAKNFVEKVEPLGTMDYSILNKQLEKVDNRYPWSLPVHGLFKSICRSGANPEKVLCICGGAMQVYHHNQ